MRDVINEDKNCITQSFYKSGRDLNIPRYFLWFPHSFTELGGFFDTAWMLVLVDLILGPFLIFFVYKENKKYLKFDINVLLTIQLFVFGAYSLYLKHPAYIVFSFDRFLLTNVSHIYPKPSWSKQLNQYLFSKPKFVVAQLPKKIKERNDLTFAVLLNDEPDIERRPKYYVPLNNHIQSIIDSSLTLEQLSLNKQEKQIVSSFLEKHLNRKDNFAYFPLKGNLNKDVVWVFDKRTFQPVEILDIDPWKFKPTSNLAEK